MRTMNLSDVGEETPLVQLVLDELLRGITSGDYGPGDRIVASGLCERLGLSLAPVREALHVLAGQGVVELHKNRGAVLRPMSPQDVIDFWPIVAAPASLAIRLAIQKIDLADNAARVEAEMALVIENANKATAFDFYVSTNEYHLTLNEIADNPFLGSLFNIYLIAYWEKFLADELPMRDFSGDYIRNYQRLTDAILTGDSRGAEAIWWYHVDWSIAILRGDDVKPGETWIR